MEKCQGNSIPSQGYNQRMEAGYEKISLTAYTYIESDLEEINAEIRAIIAHLRQKYKLADHADLHFPAVNALDRRQLEAAVKLLDRNQGLVVVSEGLFPYLSSDEMCTVVGNNRELLQEFEGCWITTDFSIKGELDRVSDQQRKFCRIVAAATEHKWYGKRAAKRESIYEC